MATDQNVSVAARLTEDRICETVTSSDMQLTEEKGSEEKDDDAHVTAKPPTNVEMQQASEVLRRGMQRRSVDFENTTNINVLLMTFSEKTIDNQL
jgi:hypothetical protein